ncbi:MAG: enoyl-CoA hydratase [Myxococcota bacterium]|jgi:enoyl-CoA hydratase
MGEPITTPSTDSFVQTTISDGVAEIVMDRPPVNALHVAGWFAVGRAIREAGDNPDVGAVLLRAEGRGFNAGVDIKEMQATEGFDSLVGANKGCYEAFAAVYECKVPVVVAVHGYCLGGGIGLAGNADIIVASDDATFSLPEVDRGALGAATHLARMVSQHKMRAMVYLCESATAQEMAAFGSIYAVVPREKLRETGLDVARRIASKPRRTIRTAKECLNGIDPVDPRPSYRWEQGFTFELNLIGEGDRARDAFVGDSTAEKKEAT